MDLSKAKFGTILWGLGMMLKKKPGKNPELKKQLQKHDAVVQMKIMDNSQGRFYIIKNGKVSSKSGFSSNPDIVLLFGTAELACTLMIPPRNQLDQINAMKSFSVDIQGPDELICWFTETLNMLTPVITKYGTDMGNGVMRYTNHTTAGVVFVYVKDGRILRVTPIDFDETDAESWTIKARDREFTPPRKTSLSPYGFASKSMVYSPDRLLYPMKRVDFDPKGERNPQNRGISGYERISWDEALDIVADEIKRMKTEHGPGSILTSQGSHHTMGNIGYYLSAKSRFMSLIGYNFVYQNPDSWEGWYWGAMHHIGHSIHLGSPDMANVTDILKECEMMVFWSSDPESTAGAYGAMEGTIRRLWLKELGIELVHINPYYCATAGLMGGKWLAPRPDTGNAMALGIAYVWITEDLYDKEYVATRTTGFDQWKDYVLGKEDGIPKTPEWQESESLISAKDVRALARKWASKKTVLAAGGAGSSLGGACRCATGIEWARTMVLLMAMRGLGKPGINFGNLQAGAPLDNTFYFPGYAEGGLSGDLETSAMSISLYQRMPQMVTLNPVEQKVPRLRIPEAIMDGKTHGYPTDGKSIERQFKRIDYPAPGYSTIKMYYKYGGSHIGTMGKTNRYVKQYQSDNLEFVVNQSIWFEGEAKFADIILPACTNFERWDIGEGASAGGYVEMSYSQLNHRAIVMQHKCIEPLGESKSDYNIFLELSKRLGLSALFSEGCSEVEWCKRLFDATDLPKKISWKEFVKKGYYIVPPPSKTLPERCGYRWFAEGRKKDFPTMEPLPGDYSREWGMGLQTQSGKIEFVSSSLKRFDPDDPERPVMPKYIPSWEGHHTTELYSKYPLNLLSPHPRYSFHTMGDGKDSFTNDVKDHRALVDGYYYWIVRINKKDAEARGIKMHDLVKMYNDRGTVICAVQITERIIPGTVHAWSSSAVYDPIGKPGESPDRGGCINILLPKRPIIKRSHSIAANTCLVEIEKWDREEL